MSELITKGDVHPTLQQEAISMSAIAPKLPAVPAAEETIPYYALPKIMVQRPSRSSEFEAIAPESTFLSCKSDIPLATASQPSNASASYQHESTLLHGRNHDTEVERGTKDTSLLNYPRTIDQMLATEREAEASKSMNIEPFRRPSKKGHETPDVSTASLSSNGKSAQVPTRAPGDSHAPNSIRDRRRDLYKHKLRNMVARNFVLEIVLGRKLAGPTKQVLRRLAIGEPVVFENPSIVS